MLEFLGSLSEQCDSFGVPLLAMMYPRGPNIKNENEYDVVSHAARIGAELGADVVKTVYTGDTNSFRRVVQGCPVPVVVAGGPRMKTDMDVLELGESSMKAGAAGLFQVMPFHFKEGENPIDPETNALQGLTYLKRSLDLANGDIRQALAGYNGGIGLIGIDETQWPTESVQYAYWGNGIYQEAQQAAAQSKTLTEWLNQGGAHLCAQARMRLGIQN